MNFFNRLQTLIVLFLLAAFGIGQAQTGQNPLTLDQAWTVLDEHNLSLQQIKTAIRQAEQDVHIAKSRFLPSVAFGASYNYVSELARYEVPFSLPVQQDFSIEAGVHNQYDAAVIIQQPIFTGFRLENALKAAHAGQEAQSMQHRILKHQLYLQVGRLYYSIQANELSQHVLQQSIKRLQFQRDKVESFLRVGRATEFDTLEVSNQLLRLSSQLQNSRNMHTILLTRFAHLLNLDSRRDIEDFQPGDLGLVLESKEAYMEAALQQRPELGQLAAVQRANAFRTDIARSAYFPQVNATASYHYARPGVNFFQDEWMDYYTLGAQLEWNVWDWKQRSRVVEKARLELRSTGLEEQKIRQSIEQQVTEALEQLQSVKQQIELQRQLVLQERRRYQIASDKFSQGVLSALDLNSIENELTTAELALNQQYIQWQQYRLQLDFATGRLQ